MNLNLSFRRNVRDNIIGSFVGNMLGWLTYEYSKKVIDNNIVAKSYDLNKYKRI